MSKKFIITIFLHGTVIMHSGGENSTREERVNQVLNGDKTVNDFATYIPIGNSVKKIRKWSNQVAKIFYLSFHGRFTWNQIIFSNPFLF